MSAVEKPTESDVQAVLGPCRQAQEGLSAEVDRLTLARRAELARHERDLAQIEEELAAATRRQGVADQMLVLLEPLQASAVPDPVSLPPTVDVVKS